MRGESTVGNGEEILGIEARASDQRAIDMVDAKDVSCIGRFDRASVEDVALAALIGIRESRRVRGE